MRSRLPSLSRRCDRGVAIRTVLAGTLSTGIAGTSITESLRSQTRTRKPVRTKSVMPSPAVTRVTEQNG